jgi:hypothetical protein
LSLKIYTPDNCKYVQEGQGAPALPAQINIDKAGKFTLSKKCQQALGVSAGDKIVIAASEPKKWKAYSEVEPSKWFIRKVQASAAGWTLRQRGTFELTFNSSELAKKIRASYQVPADGPTWLLLSAATFNTDGNPIAKPKPGEPVYYQLLLKLVIKTL